MHTYNQHKPSHHTRPSSTEATVSKDKRSLSKEVVTALLSATFLGFGTLFLLLWVGVYV